jgi:hypothetical protein
VPLLKSLSTVTEALDLPSLTKFLAHVWRVVKGGNLSLNNRMKAKQYVKKYIATNYDREEDAEYYTVYFKSGISYNKSDFTDKQKQADAAVEVKNKNVLVVEHNKVESFVQNLLSKDRDAVDNIILAQLSIGARLIELIQPKVSEWSMVKESGDIRQAGTAKSVDKKILVKTPIFVNGIEFLRLIISIRKELKSFLNFSNESFTSYLNSKLNARIKKYMIAVGVDHPQLSSSHGLRRLYVAYSFFKRLDQTESLLAYYARNLGHVGFGSIANYSTITVV